MIQLKIDDSEIMSTFSTDLAKFRAVANGEICDWMLHFSKKKKVVWYLGMVYWFWNIDISDTFFSVHTVKKSTMHISGFLVI